MCVCVCECVCVSMCVCVCVCDYVGLSIFDLILNWKRLNSSFFFLCIPKF